MIHNSAAPTERKMAAFSSIITCQHYCRKPVTFNHEDTAHKPDNWKWQGRPGTIKIYLKRTYLPLFYIPSFTSFVIMQYLFNMHVVLCSYIHTCMSSQFRRHYFLICFGPESPLQNQGSYFFSPRARFKKEKNVGGGKHDDVYSWSNISNWNNYLSLSRCVIINIIVINYLASPMPGRGEANGMTWTTLTLRLSSLYPWLWRACAPLNQDFPLLLRIGYPQNKPSKLY